MKRNVPLRRTASLSRVSQKRARELKLYHARRVRFLSDHPYCQVWLADHGVTESVAVARRGILRFGSDLPPVFVPVSETVHHRNKRRGGRLLDENFWMAVSRAGHRLIESRKRWARERGYLLPF